MKRRTKSAVLLSSFVASVVVFAQSTAPSQSAVKPQSQGAGPAWVVPAAVAAAVVTVAVVAANEPLKNF